MKTLIGLLSQLDVTKIFTIQGGTDNTYSQKIWYEALNYIANIVADRLERDLL